VEVTLSEAQDGAQLAVYMSDTLVVRLSETAGDGYRWTLASCDTSFLEMTGHRYETSRAGAGGASVWKFRPKRAGRTRLVMSKRRLAMAGDQAQERFAVELDIR
jgi:predicted secreted protein